MNKRFVSQPMEAVAAAASEADRTGHLAPALPSAFLWEGEVLEVIAVREERRSTKVDRGDVYLKRHWYAFETTGNRIATVYFDRGAKRGAPRWWLYTIEDR